MLLSELLKVDIVEMVEAGEWNELRQFLASQPAPEIAELLGTLDRRTALVVFRLLPRALAAEAFSLLDTDVQNRMIEHLASEDVREVLTRLTPDDRTALFEELPAAVTHRLLDLLPESQRRESLTLLSYPEGSVGRLMTTAWVRVRPEWTAAETIEHLRLHGRDSETMAVLYVTDDRGRLTASIPLRRVVLAPPATPLRDLMEAGPGPVLRSMQSEEEAVAIFTKYDAYALPVVDDDGVLLGIVTSDDILAVAQAATTEDFHKIAKVSPIEGSLRRARLWDLYRSRIGWLVTLIGVNMFSTAALAHFQPDFDRDDLRSILVVLVSFLPLLIGSAGNAGSQTATLAIRSMALGEIRRGMILPLVWRELRVSVLIGLILAAGVFALGLTRGTALVAEVAAASMLVVIVFGSSIGLLLPLALRRLGFDPAAAGAPLITSLADIGGIIIYFSIARAVLLRG